MKYITTALAVVFMLGISLPRLARAQDNTVHGKVTDTEGETLPGVNILVEGTTTGTATGSDGTYELTVPSLSDTLMFTYIGYQAQAVPINGRTTINVQMKSAVGELEDVVVVGYGTQEKATMTGSVSSVSMENLKEAPVPNFSNTLAGKLSGIVTVNGSGEPGYDGATIRIRGNHSLNNNAPLVVIDGVPDRAGGLDRLDPNDIKSISVLKDATAAIYGSEAANGVILVTTKSGYKNQAPEFSFNINQGFNQPTRIPNMTDAPTYMTMLNEINLYRGNPPIYTQDEIQKFRDPNADPWLYPNTDWFSEALKPISYQTKGNMSVQGGTQNLTYFLSLGGQTEDGFYEKSATRYNQINFRSNITSQVAKNVKLKFNLSGRWEDRNFPTVSAGATFRMLMRGKPNEPAYFPNGLPGPDIENGQNPVVTGTTQTGYDHDQRYFLTSDLGLTITIPNFDGFDLQARLSYDKQFQDHKTWQKPWTLYAFDKQGYINNGMSNPEQFLTGSPKGPSDPELTQRYYQQRTILGNLVANYQRDITEDHSIKLMLGTERQTFEDAGFNAFRRHFISTKIDQLFAGGQQDWTNDGSASHGARQNYFGRANYSYQDKYLFEFVGRYDGSYLFPENSRYGFFPAFSAGWRLTEEDFFKNNVSLFDDLKLRGSWGKTGNDITNPNALVEARQYLASYQFGGGYVFGVDQLLKSIYQANTPNPNVTWENSSQVDVGFDASMFDNRLSVTFDYFNEMRKGILIYRNASVPNSTGLSLPRENLGKVKSWGYDGSVTWNNQVNNDFAYNVKLNAGYSTDKIVFWDEPPGAPDYQKSTGKKIYTNLFYKVDGVFQDQQQVDNTPHWNGARPGDLIFRDVNGDGKITADDRVRINKNGFPDVTGGITLGASYKQFDASIFFQGAAGAVQYVNTQSGDFGNYFNAYAQKRWRPDPNSQNGMEPDPSGLPYSGPRAYNRADEYWSPQGGNRNTYFLRSTDYLRLKTAQIGYTIPPDVLDRMGVKSLRIYANGFNLLTWDKFKLMDPEASSESGSYYPQTRVINVGLNLSF